MTASGSILTRPIRLPPVPWARWADRAGRASAWVLGPPLTIALATACVGLLASWAPHYLTWPWWNDHDHFGTFAHAWRLGAPMPYRDLPSFQFPGEYYVFFLLGTTFGWGRTVPLYAADVALLVGLGLALIAWGRRLFGRAAPGLVGYLMFVVYYLNLPNDVAAQRDWHASLLAVLALMAAEVGRSRAARVGSALALAAAAATRPHVVLLLPAMALAIDEGARREGESFGRTARAALEWAVAFALGLALAFAPLVWFGLLDDFLRTLRLTAVGTEYNELSRLNFWPRVRAQFVDRPYLTTVPVALAVLAASFARGRRRTVATWLVAMAGSIFYKPLSPREHFYLTHNHMLVWSVATALLAGLILGLPEDFPAAWRARLPRRVSEALRLPGPAVRLGLLVMLMARMQGPRPQFASVGDSLRALPALVRGEMPADEPHCGLSPPRPWADYRAVIGYLREHARPGTYVGNALGNLVALDGPVGALPPMPGESLSWFLHFKQDPTPLAVAYAERLAASPAEYVVWMPEERGLGLLPNEVADVVVREFEPAAAFGPYEVRRRRSPGHRPSTEPSRR